MEVSSKVVLLPDNAPIAICGRLACVVNSVVQVVGAVHSFASTIRAAPVGATVVVRSIRFGMHATGMRPRNSSQVMEVERVLPQKMPVVGRASAEMLRQSHAVVLIGPCPVAVH